MLRISKKTASGLTFAFILGFIPSVHELKSQELPRYLRDRGTGVATSLPGTYVRDGELLIYSFFEYYADGNFEYKPSDLGYGLDFDYRGRYHESEGLLFLAYGITPDLALELEGAVTTAELVKSPNDSTAVPGEFEESGLGDVETQIRWRFLSENESRPEAFTYFSTVFPFQRTRKLIGTQDWEFNLGFGVTRGFGWGTMTLRAAGMYSREARKFDVGEYALQYLKRFSSAWRVALLVEGNQFDEVALITEAQWHFHPRYYLKLNNGFGLTKNATDFAPEVGLICSF